MKKIDITSIFFMADHVAQNWNTVYSSLLEMYKKLAELDKTETFTAEKLGHREWFVLDFARELF